MTADTRIAIASGGKGFTALAIMRLIEDGTLTLDQPVRALLGDDLPLVDEEGDRSPAHFVMLLPVHTLTTTEAFLPALEGHPQSTPGCRS